MKNVIHAPKDWSEMVGLDINLKATHHDFEAVDI